MATGKGSVISTYIKTLLETNQQALGIDRIYYGEQRVLGAGVVVMVEPTRKNAVNATLGQIQNINMDTGIIIAVTGDEGVENIQLRADQLLEEIWFLLNKDSSPNSLGIGGTQLGGNVSYGWCTAAEHAYRIPGSQLTRINRILFTSMSRTNLVES